MGQPVPVVDPLICFASHELTPGVTQIVRGCPRTRRHSSVDILAAPSKTTHTLPIWTRVPSPMAEPSSLEPVHGLPMERFLLQDMPR